MRTNQIVAGALMDFIGSLTTLPKPMTVWAGTEVYPLHEHFGKWASDRGLDLTTADVEHWQERLKEAPVDPFEAHLSAESLGEIEAIVSRVVRESSLVR